MNLPRVHCNRFKHKTRKESHSTEHSHSNLWSASFYLAYLDTTRSSQTVGKEASLIEIMTPWCCFGPISQTAWGLVSLLRTNRPHTHISHTFADLYGIRDVARRLLSTSSVSQDKQKWTLSRFLYSLQKGKVYDHNPLLGQTFVSWTRLLFIIIAEFTQL